MQNEKEIIAAIAAYLEKNCNGYGEFIHFKDYAECWDVHVATEIAAAIAPMVEEKDLPYTDLFGHMANEHGLTLTNTELGDIIHIARGK